MEQALTGLPCQGLPSTRDEAAGLRVAGAPACERIAFAAGWRDTTIGPVTADSSRHDVRDTGGLGPKPTLTLLANSQTRPSGVLWEHNAAP